MGYKPEVVSDKVIRAQARVVKAKNEKTGKTKWRLNVSVYDAKTKAWVAWDTPIFVEQANAPHYLKNGDWSVKLSADKSKILSAVPDSETVICQFKDIAHQEGKPYQPYIKPGFAKQGEEPKPWVQFVLTYEVVEGDFEGVVIEDWVNYNFGPAPKTYKDRKVTAYHPGGTRTEELAARLEALGVWEFGPIFWEGPDIVYNDKKLGVNILNEIAKRARKAALDGRKVRIGLAKGQVASIKEAVDDDALVSDDSDEEVTTPAEDATDDGGIESETLPEDGEVEWGDTDEESEE